MYLLLISLQFTTTESCLIQLQENQYLKKEIVLHLFYRYLQKEPVKFYSFLLDT